MIIIILYNRGLSFVYCIWTFTWLSAMIRNWNVATFASHVQWELLSVDGWGKIAQLDSIASLRHFLWELGGNQAKLRVILLIALSFAAPHIQQHFIHYNRDSFPGPLPADLTWFEMTAAAEVMRDIDQFFEGPSGPPKFDLTEVHHRINGLVLHTDFSLARPAIPLIPPNSTFVDGVASKDVTIDTKGNIRARIFLPEIAESCKSKLPLLLYFHGGGFVCLSVDSQMFHDFCEDLCKNVKAIVVSLEYRLAPEYRLPSQYEDARIALEWLRSHAETGKAEENALDVQLESAREPRVVSQAQASEVAALMQSESLPELETNTGVLDSESTLDSWLVSYADFNRFFLVGDSAGGNIVHNLLSEYPPEIHEPLHLSGLILIQPAFGGLRRTAAELRFAHKWPCSFDIFWKLALPSEADRSHHYCDVFPKLNDLLQSHQLSFPYTFIVVGGEDLLLDWDLLYYETLKRFGTKIKLVTYDDAVHGFYTLRHHELTNKLLRDIAEFVANPSATVDLSFI